MSPETAVRQHPHSLSQVEDDLKGMLPCSSKQPFTDTATPTYANVTISNIQTSRVPTLNVTLTNIEAHPKTAETELETPYRNLNSATNTKRTSASSR